MRKLAIISTHPIQYNAPLFKLLASQPSLEVKVFYTLGKTYTELKDNGFGKAITWDIPLLEGYEYEFLHNTSEKPGTSHFRGVVNPDIIETIKAFQPTAILIYGWNFVSHLKVMRYFKNRVPVYFRGDSTVLDEQKGFKVLVRRMALKWVYQHIDKAFYVGTHNKKYFLAHGVKEQNLIFAPHAIDNDRFGEDAKYVPEGKLIRVDLGIPGQNTLFLFSGKFENKKSPLLLLKAFKNISQNRVSLLFVGDGNLENHMKAEAAGYTNIHFLPFQNQVRMPAVYRAADVLVLPSGGPGETWGLSVNEAMASGLPVITSTKVGCAVDLVQDNVNGHKFEAGSAASLTEKLALCAAKTKDELKEMGHASREIIADWSFEHVCAAIVANLP